MEFGSIKKLFVRLLAGVLSFAMLVTCLSGCTLRDTSIWREEITLQCEEPYMITTYYRDEKGVGGRETYMEINGEIQTVELHYVSAIFDVLLRDNSTHESGRLLSGTWKERKGNLILYIEEDFVFGNQYETIVLTPQDDDTP